MSEVGATAMPCGDVSRLGYTDSARKRFGSKDARRRAARRRFGCLRIGSLDRSALACPMLWECANFFGGSARTGVCGREV
jgi:hypothetical protein